jgi:hypothetical protein
MKVGNWALAIIMICHGYMTNMNLATETDIDTITFMDERRKTMKGKWGVAVLMFGILVAASIPALTDVMPGSKSLTVHEWGTFTSVAGKEGHAVEWLPADWQSDLPCFVNVKHVGAKRYWFATVRMETPVVYFYASNEMNVNVTVRFPNGRITEWYPQAKVTDRYLDGGKELSTLEWRDVKVLPGASLNFPTESAPSHYYAARQTDATPVSVKDQREKFLFYRGLGDFPVPISAKVERNGKILLWNTGEAPIPGVILFESRAGRLGYRIVGSLKGAVTVDPPTLNADPGSLERELKQILGTAGLYPREAAAMVATWRDSWFEEGTRVFYIVPAGSVDANLPLNIDPRPGQIARAFVGRLEVITAATENAVADAIRTGNNSGLVPYSRFLRPVVDQLVEKSANLEDKRRFEKFAEKMWAEVPDNYPVGSSACKR